MTAQSPSTTSESTQPKAVGGFFSEDNGSKSSMRLMSFIALMAAIAFGILTILNPTKAVNGTDGIYITFGFLLSAFAPKAIQKFAETKL
ncbi:MAG: hypothetical protein AAGA80_00245 [Cyanobacteria bacterium P01_F01_bin.143]